MNQVAHDICQKQLRQATKKNDFELSENFICAGGNENDICNDDAGNALVCPIAGTDQYVLTGLASYGVKCFTETPGVYTNVLKYLDWIKEQTAPA